MNRPFSGKPALKKQESCSSILTTETEVSSASFQSSLDHSNHSHHSSVSGHTSKSVTFDVDKYDDVCETVYEYPAIEEEDIAELYWSKDEVAARSEERHAMVKHSCAERTRFIACVEELFQVPMKKRLSTQNLLEDSSESSQESAVMTEEEAMEALVTSEYRGYEHHCCRAIVSFRRRAIRQILASHWVRGGKQIEVVAAKQSQRQQKFAYLVGQADAMFAAEYLSL